MNLSEAREILMKCSSCVDGISLICSNGNCLMAGYFLEGHKAGVEEAIKIAKENNQKHIGFAGDYDAGARHCSGLILKELSALTDQKKGEV